MLICCFELLCVLYLNDGYFTYSLDDAYIHFSIAEGITSGTYGINPNEFTAPGSSIVWPFFMAALSFIGELSIITLCLNFFISIAVIQQIYLIFKQTIFAGNERLFRKYWLWVSVFYIVLCNLVGLTFIGMEHNLQLLLAIYVVRCLINFDTSKELPIFFWLALILMPLVRYECLAFVLPILAYMFFQKQQSISVIAGICVLIALVSFSIFLKQNGMHILPNSVIAKSSPISGIPPLLKYSFNFAFNVINPFGWSLLFLSVVLIRKFLKTKKVLALIFAMAGFGHLVAGQLWWYGRYETYLLMSLSIMAVYLHKDAFITLLDNKGLRSKKISITAILMCIPSIFILLTIPLGAHAIYLQNVHLHQYATEYHKGSVAIHDIGIASYKNDFYVLDLWGLANKEALDNRQSHDREDTSWLKALVDKHNVDVIWLTDGWFKSVPDEWVKVATFYRNDISNALPGIGPVTFYARNKSAVPQVKQSLQNWQPSLTSPSYLSFFD